MRFAEAIVFDQTISEIKFERRVAVLVMADMSSVAPAVGEKIGSTNGQNGAFVSPGFVIRNDNRAAVPAHLVTRRGAMIAAIDFERMAEHAIRVIIIIARRVTFTPRGERFPTERDDDLFPPFGSGGIE